MYVSSANKFKDEFLTTCERSSTKREIIVDPEQSLGRHHVDFRTMKRPPSERALCAVVHVDLEAGNLFREELSRPKSRNLLN